METVRVIKKVLGVIAGIAIAAVGVQDRIHHAHLHDVGKPALVQPLNRYSTHDRNVNDVYYTSMIHFTTDNGERVAVEKTFPKDVLDDFQAKRSVVVLYAPDDATDFIFQKEKS